MSEENEGGEVNNEDLGKTQDTELGDEAIPSVAPEVTIQSSRSSGPKSRAQVKVSDIVAFVFPEDLQHPLAAARLFVYGDYGPLDEFGNLRSGPGGKHILSVWELDCMCSQIEREDILQIYLHRGREMGLLSKMEQEEMIAQADGHLKRAKGKAMLPHIKASDIYNILGHIEEDEYGYVSFHEVQKALMLYRKTRVKEYKLVFPSIAGGNQSKNKNKNKSDDITMDMTLSKRQTSMKKSKKKKKISRVSDIVAPKTMFQYNEGQNNVEIVDTTNKLLCKYASVLNELDSQNDTNVVANVRLLRTVEPTFKNPYISKKTGQISRPPFEFAKLAQGSSLGSGVKTANSSSTWKKKYTSY
jgi:hypothetical protein